MGRLYDKSYHVAPHGGRYGTMICSSCGRQIDEKNQDFREAKRSDPKEDWGYVTHHRKCLNDEPGFLEQEKLRNIASERAINIRNAAIAFRDEWGVSDLDELIQDNSS